MKPNSSLHRLTLAGIIAALYTALTLILPIASFGPVQLRFSELLTILPVFTPVAVPGLTLGCALANAIGLATGANLAGVLDIPIGATATLLAALCTYALRHVRFKQLPVLATLPPVVFNALIIGGELCVVTTGTLDPAVFALTAAQVGLGQLTPCVAGGLILFKCLQKAGIDRKIDPKS